jgi:dUTP diphosphatase
MQFANTDELWIFMPGPNKLTFAQVVDVECANLGFDPDVAELLKRKNAAYGNSALAPLRCWSTASAAEQIRVRLDDKLSRILRGKNKEAVPEDTVQDMKGYWVLLKVAENYELVGNEFVKKVSRGEQMREGFQRMLDRQHERSVPQREYVATAPDTEAVPIELPFMKLREDAIVPTKAYENDSGFDLYTPVAFSLDKFETKRIETGIAVQIPEGFEVQARPRSGNSSKGLLVHLGTVDQGYRGDLMVVMTNTTEGIVYFNPKDKVAQFVLCPIPRVRLKQVESLEHSERGGKGFGSSGA